MAAGPRPGEDTPGNQEKRLRWTAGKGLLSARRSEAVPGPASRDGSPWNHGSVAEDVGGSCPRSE